MRIVQVGKEAPDFAAQAWVNGCKENIRLSQFRGGWTLLCFYPGEGCSISPIEMAAIREKLDEFQRLGVQIIGIGTGCRFNPDDCDEAEMQETPYPVIFDVDGWLGRVFGIYDEETGVDLRACVLIDPDGIVQAMEVLTPPVGRNVTEILRLVRAFQHVRETGKAAPPGWQPNGNGHRHGTDVIANVWHFKSHCWPLRETT